MGCACSREHSFDKGSYSIYSTDSPGALAIQVKINDPKSRVLWTNQKLSTENTFLLKDVEVKRQEQQSEILEDGYLFTLNEIEFDEARIDKLYAPMTFELTWNNVYKGTVTLTNMKFSLFNMSKESAILKDENDNQIVCDVFYCSIGRHFNELRTLSLKHLTLNEQIDILNKILIARNNEKNLSNKAKIQIRQFLGEKETNVKVRIFEKLVEIPGEKSGVVIKEFLTYYNPYQINLTYSFKNFIKNVVSKDPGLEEFAKNLIETNIQDSLVYENKESLLLMLKHAFYRGEDCKGYFRTLAKNSIGTTEKVKDLLETPGIFESLFVPAFQKDRVKAMKVCSFLTNFIGVEDFLKANWEKLKALLKLEEDAKEEGIGDFMEFANNMEKK